MILLMKVVQTNEERIFSAISSIHTESKTLFKNHSFTNHKAKCQIEKHPVDFGNINNINCWQ